MNSIRYAAELFLWVAAFCAFYVRPAYAYLDPGSGSLLLQFLLASLVGALFLIRKFWRLILTFLRRVADKLPLPNKQDYEDKHKG